MRRYLSLLKKGDFVIMGVILGSFLLSLGVLSPRLHGGQLQLVVSVGGKEVYRQWWDREGTYTVDIDLPGKGEAVLEVSPTGVRMRPLPLEICPGQICSHLGTISRPGQAIICLPNRLIVELVGDSMDAEIDGITQ
ncbi:MAG TPA: NusG domain II-containing protein [Firmicutes bacterium]|nr:NusG domain II-containing protein [Bacillota bacterium]